MLGCSDALLLEEPRQEEEERASYENQGRLREIVIRRVRRFVRVSDENGYQSQKAAQASTGELLLAQAQTVAVAPRVATPHAPMQVALASHKTPHRLGKPTYLHRGTGKGTASIQSDGRIEARIACCIRVYSAEASALA